MPTKHAVSVHSAHRRNIAGIKQHDQMDMRHAIAEALATIDHIPGESLDGDRIILEELIHKAVIEQTNRWITHEREMGAVPKDEADAAKIYATTMASVKLAITHKDHGDRFVITFPVEHTTNVVHAGQQSCDEATTRKSAHLLAKDYEKAARAVFTELGIGSAHAKNRDELPTHGTADAGVECSRADLDAHLRPLIDVADVERTSRLLACAVNGFTAQNKTTGLRVHRETPVDEEKKKEHMAALKAIIEAGTPDVRGHRSVLVKSRNRG